MTRLAGIATLYALIAALLPRGTAVGLGRAGAARRASEIAEQPEAGAPATPAPEPAEPEAASTRAPSS